MGQLPAFVNKMSLLLHAKTGHSLWAYLSSFTSEKETFFAFSAWRTEHVSANTGHVGRILDKPREWHQESDGSLIPPWSQSDLDVISRHEEEMCHWCLESRVGWHHSWLPGGMHLAKWFAHRMPGPHAKDGTGAVVIFNTHTLPGLHHTQAGTPAPVSSNCSWKKRC